MLKIKNPMNLISVMMGVFHGKTQLYTDYILETVKLTIPAVILYICKIDEPFVL
jgi:hypothetical protein